MELKSGVRWSGTYLMTRKEEVMVIGKKNCYELNKVKCTDKTYVKNSYGRH